MELHYVVDTLAEKLSIYVNSFDVTGQSKHYNWKFTETWDYVSQLAAYTYFDVFEVKSTKTKDRGITVAWNSRQSQRYF
jgi:hypothetical protein